MDNSRKHFSLEQWADFGRGRASEEARAEMQAHLAAGCQGCTQIVELWGTVLNLAHREGTFEPPANALRCAKALFAAFRPVKEKTFSLRLAHFVGFRPPALQGVRGGAAPAASHFLFKEGSLLLDMYMQPSSSFGMISLVGQVLDSTKPDKPFENLEVLLLQERDTRARTSTNEFGEFYLEFYPGEDLLLTIALEDGSCLVTPVPPQNPSQSFL